MRSSTLTRTLLLAAMLAGAGCATSGRYIVLKEFAPPAPSQENSPLKGRTVCVKPIACGFNINDKLPDKNTTEPPNYTYVSMTKEETKMWDEQDTLLRKNMQKSELPQIGYVRNGFGAVMSKVYALNDPGLWLTDTLKADLEKLGARVVDATQEADAEMTVGGTIRYLKIDIYMSYWADLIVDVQLKPKTQPATTRSIHTKAGRVAWTSSSYEYYQSLRECQQKFSRLVIADLEQLGRQ
ncbi:MAG: hypothetical protein ABSA47_00900 [Verrucomicrobiota bacterium]